MGVGRGWNAKWVLWLVQLSLAFEDILGIRGGWGCAQRVLINYVI